MSGYVPPRPGDRTDGMEWTGSVWTPICPVDECR